MSLSPSSNNSQNTVHHQYQIFNSSSNFLQPLPPLKRTRQENWNYLTSMNPNPSFIEDHYHQVTPKRMAYNSIVYDDNHHISTYDSTTCCCCRQPKPLYQVDHNKHFRIGSNHNLPLEQQVHYKPYPKQENLPDRSYRIPVDQHSRLMEPSKPYPSPHFDEINHIIKPHKDQDLQTAPYHTESRYSPQYIPDQRLQSYSLLYQYHQLQNPQYNPYKTSDMKIFSANNLPQQEHSNSFKKRLTEIDISPPSLSPKDLKMFNSDQSTQSKSEARRNASQKRLRDSKGRFTSKIRYVSSKPLPSIENSLFISNTNH